MIGAAYMPDWMHSEIAIMRRLWNNGGKALLIAAGGFAASIVILAGAGAYHIVTRPASFAPLRNVNPQQVATPLVEQGGFVDVTGTLCNDAKEGIGFDSRVWIRKVDTGALIPYAVRLAIVRIPGCETRHFHNPVPADLPPGIYRLEGVDTAYSDDGRIQREPWFTQPFQVVPRKDADG